jgi:peptidoglycan/xylan/chitin deacetylase (PgdA/CDA1 family)
MRVQSSSAKRWLKRCARRAFARGSLLAGVGWGGRLTPGLRILTYHRVTKDPADPFAVSPGDFALQMQEVALTGTVVPLEKALEELGGGDDRRPRIALTFDDGTRDFLTDALPVLSRLGLPATLYVSPARVGEEGFLCWDDLRAVSAGGIRLGSHGLDHQSLGRISPGEVWTQVRESRRMLEERLHVTVTSLAYPYGTVRDFSEVVKKNVSMAGYRSACTSINGVNRSSTDPLELRRTKIEQADGAIFRRILLGGMDGWAFVDRNLTLLQNRYV